MFGISSTELLVILLVAIVAVGPEKMPRVMRAAGKMFLEFRRLKTDFQRIMNMELANLEKKTPPEPAPARFADRQPDRVPEPLERMPDKSGQDAGTDIPSEQAGTLVQDPQNTPADGPEGAVSSGGKEGSA
ncbi:MAG: twin-arginine translocase TatA/TatE family subunit [Deltaproteobacteria bacterium]|jgi:sec-independent protein translocase protein TatB|nr:twin-arginine translocase TatA/TatE family subunit [Deltaproteobacteria bacterium]